MWTLLSLVGLCALQSAFGAVLTVIPDLNLNGDKLKGPAMQMVVNTDNNVLKIQFTAPYVQSDSADNRVHLFLANADHRITEVEFTPSSSTLRLYWAPFNVLRTVSVDDDPATFTASTEVGADKATWTGTATVAQDLLPPRISRYNAANVHPAAAGSSVLQYDALYAITNYAISVPDLMVLSRYKELGPRFLFNNDGVEYSKQWQAKN
ncbi:uncharacterized protein LOC117645301 [Thrips palmi]|uniref:Uncharacterized protein LOC117645301 n=1 Tax=Thrips palmi TaxID=161013 RepID=A0A6P8YMT5_THRPL|nr:uncharacterized protein LOC117645301 [Thrips palmi]